MLASSSVVVHVVVVVHVHIAKGCPPSSNPDFMGWTCHPSQIENPWMILYAMCIHPWNLDDFTLNFILRFHWTFMDRRAREMWSACETRSRLHAHLMYSLAASQPIFPTLLAIIAGPVERSIAAAVRTCNTALCCCGDMCVCVCVYERSRCVWT
jgi:hypothetical protein